MLVDVALPLPLFRTFTYAVEDRREPLDAGTRVLVPFRNRKEIGIVVGAGTEREGITPKPVAAIPDDAPVLDPPMLALCRWIAQYYVVPRGVERRGRSRARAEEAARGAHRPRASLAPAPRQHLRSRATATRALRAD